MVVDNPLCIFTDDQLEDLDLAKLKSIKKEILLSFQLTSSPVIELNGIEIDKNGVLEVFELLENKLTHYLFIHNNKILDDFLNRRSDLFLTDEEALSRLQEYGVDSSLESQIVARVQDLAWEYFKNDRENRISNLENIFWFVLRFNPNLEDQIYHKLYDRLRITIAKLEDVFGAQLSNQESHHLPVGVHKYISYGFFKAIACLPPLFDGLVMKYCLWCKKIVYHSLRKENTFNKFTRKDLKKIEVAATIAAERLEIDNYREIAEQIKNFLKSGGGTSSSRTFYLIIAGAIFVIKLFLLIGNGIDSNSSSSRYDERMSHLRGSDSEYIDKLIRSQYPYSEKRRNEVRVDTTGNASKKRKEESYSTLAFSGENIKSTNSRLVKENHFEAHSELTYHVDVFPTYSSNLNSLVPRSLIEKYSGQVRPVVFHFENPKIKGHQFSHRILVDLNGASHIPEQDYQLKTPVESEDLYLSMKTISKTDYPLQGIYSRLSRNGKVLQSTMFKIDYTRQDGYQVSSLSSGDESRISKEYLADLGGSRTMKESDRFAIALKNLSLVHNTYLKQGSIYSIKNTLGYTIANSSNNQFAPDEMFSETCILKSYITSREDNTSYVRLSGEEINIKYLADNASGRIQGMIMVSASTDRSEIERLQIFSTK